MEPVNSRFVRIFLIALGVISLSLGVIGIFLPLLPTTPFLILSSWCFLKSSEKLYRWLYNQPKVGKVLRSWDNNHSISKFNKVLSITMIIVSYYQIWFLPVPQTLKFAVGLLLIAVSIYIATRNEP